MALGRQEAVAAELADHAEVPAISASSGQPERSSAAACVRKLAGGVCASAGHGPEAVAAAEAGCRSLAEACAEKTPDRRAFERASGAVKGAVGTSDSLSGCSALCLLLHPSGTLSLASCGSVGAIAVATASRSHNRYGVRSIQLTSRHTTSNARECQRIQDKGGIITQQEYAKDKASGSPRVFVENGHTRNGAGPGLLTTRSLGDRLGKTIGVTCEPDLSEHSLDPSTWRFILVGSDLLWRHFSEDDVAAYVHKWLELHCKQSDWSGVCEALASAAQRKARQSASHTSSIDDCFVAVIRWSFVNQRSRKQHKQHKQHSTDVQHQENNVANGSVASEHKQAKERSAARWRVRYAATGAAVASVCVFVAGYAVRVARRYRRA